MQKENYFEELYDRAQKTANSRFNAHRRLTHHNNASLWTISCFSIGLIVIPLIQTFGLETRFSSEYNSFIQVVLAIVILVISIILNMTNFAVRADKIHACGMALNTFSRKVHKCTREPYESNDYDRLVNEYEGILQQYENHSNIDYLFTKMRMTNYYKSLWWFPVYVYGLYTIQFLPYILLLAIELVWIYMLVTHTT